MAPNVGRIACAVAALALSTSAQSQFGTVGALSPGSLGDTPEAKELLAEYGRTPNATSQLTFNRGGEHMLETWGWRLNVTEVPVPNNPRLFGNASANSSENLTVTNVQWQLDWPGDESDTLQSFLGQRNWTLFSWNLRAVLPLNITDHINSETKDNCSAILGAECAASLEEQAAKDRDASFSDLAGCASTLDVGYQGGWGFGIDSNVTNNSSLYHNGTFSYYTSTPHPRDNTTLFAETIWTVQILLLGFSPAPGTGLSDPGSALSQIIVPENQANAATTAWTRPALALVWSLAALLSALLVL